jgi:hypothetical protein
LRRVPYSTKSFAQAASFKGVSTVKKALLVLLLLIGVQVGLSIVLPAVAFADCCNNNNSSSNDKP